MRSNLFLIIGEDSKAIDFNIYKILENIEYDDNNKIIYDMNVNKFNEVIEEASMGSLFSSVKVIIVNNFSVDNIDDREFECLEKIVDVHDKDIYMIFITKRIDARKKSYKLFKDNFSILDCEKIDNNDVYNYIEGKINSRGFKVNSVNIEYFLSKVGNDINNINNELQKLFIYKNEDKNILREDIDLLVFDNIDSVIYEFTNAILDDEIDKVKNMYDKFLLDNISFDYLISTVAGSFRTSLIIKLLHNKNMSNFDIGKVIGKKEYFVKKSLDRLYRYSVNDLSNYINKLAIIDREYKSGKDNINKFELFLFSRENL